MEEQLPFLLLDAPAELLVIAAPAGAGLAEVDELKGIPTPRPHQKLKLGMRGDAGGDVGRGIG